jgi:hypothetical protein
LLEIKGLEIKGLEIKGLEIKGLEIKGLENKVMRGLDPRIHHVSKRWIAGSSPAMTGEQVARFTPPQNA